MAQSVGEVSLDIVAGKNNIGSVVKSSMNECQDAVNKGSSGIGGALGKIGSVVLWVPYHAGVMHADPAQGVACRRHGCGCEQQKQNNSSGNIFHR